MPDRATKAPLPGRTGEAPPPGRLTEAPPAGRAGVAPSAGRLSVAPVVGQVGAAPPVGRAGEVPPPGRLTEAPPAGRAGEAPSAGRLGVAPPVGQMGGAPSAGQVSETPPPGRLSEAPLPGRVGGVPPAGRAGDVTVTRLSQLAALMRPELPDLTREIIAEIRERVPEYARPMDGPYGQALRVGVQQALESFFESIADPSAPLARRDHICRRLGQAEAMEGRSLDSLQAAYRIGVHVGWRRVMDVGLRCGAPSPVMSQLADAVLAYMDELATLSRQGYLEAKARSGQSREEWRRRLLQLILERPQAPRRAIAELAELTGWPVPEEVTLVAMEPGVAGAPALGDAGALVEIGCPHPHLLLPGPVDTGRRAGLERALAGRRSAVGLTVPMADAAHSLRWARRALALGRGGVIADGGVTFCEDHLVELCLLADEPLVDQLARRQLSALAGLTPLQRQRLTETLCTWLETRGTAAEMAQRLNVHPQTVRYRMRKLEKTFGGQLDDPGNRFAMELVLRATRLRGRPARGDDAGVSGGAGSATGPAAAAGAGSSNGPAAAGPAAETSLASPTAGAPSRGLDRSTYPGRSPAGNAHSRIDGQTYP